MTKESNEAALVELHKAYWNKELDRPIVNIDASCARRFGFVPGLPPEWENRGDFLLDLDTLTPEKYQPAPFVISDQHPLHGDVAFNTWLPYFRIPWLSAIIGGQLHVSPASHTIWPHHAFPENWHELDSLGLNPCPQWRDRLLEFLKYLIDHWHPDHCIPAQDMIGRGPGDLLVGLMGHEMFYNAMYLHPEPLKRLVDAIADIYIDWAESQLAMIPQFHGGYCNQYGMWSPGSYTRFQEDYAINLSEDLFREFLMPATRRIMERFEYQVFHTHSGFARLPEWLMEVDALKVIEVALDPMGPPLKELIPKWNRILEKKYLLILAELTQPQLDLLCAELSPKGLWLDLTIVPNEVIATS